MTYFLSVWYTLLQYLSVTCWFPTHTRAKGHLSGVFNGSGVLRCCSAAGWVDGITFHLSFCTFFTSKNSNQTLCSTDDTDLEFGFALLPHWRIIWWVVVCFFTILRFGDVVVSISSTKWTSSNLCWWWIHHFTFKLYVPCDESRGCVCLKMLLGMCLVDVYWCFFHVNSYWGLFSRPGLLWWLTSLGWHCPETCCPPALAPWWYWHPLPPFHLEEPLLPGKNVESILKSCVSLLRIWVDTFS